MRSPTRATLGCAAAAVVAAGAGGCGSSAPTSASPPVGCSTAGAASTAQSADYRYVLNLGPVEGMYSESQVAATHPKTGEVMLNGTMSMAQGPDARHLEVHICSRPDSRVVVGATPSITVTDATAGTTTAIPVTTMQGVTSGQSDLHYGNNVDLPPGHAFVVHVALRGQQAALPFTQPA